MGDVFNWLFPAAAPPKPPKYYAKPYKRPAPRPTPRPKPEPASHADEACRPWGCRNY